MADSIYIAKLTPKSDTYCFSVMCSNQLLLVAIISHEDHIETEYEKTKHAKFETNQKPVQTRKTVS